MANFYGMVGNDMKLKIVLKKGWLKHKGSFLGIFILFFVISLSLVTALNISVNSMKHISLEMERLGFGDITVWVHQNQEIDEISEDLKNNEDIDDIKIQPLIFSGYSIHDKHSDNEGQLLAYHPNEYNYQLLDKNFQNIQTTIADNEIYVSPAMHSTYDFQIGDQITFDISRSSQPKVYTIQGYFEDPFMGSSMIDMKSFLINDHEFTQLSQDIQNTSEFNQLSRIGAMLHIFQKESSQLTFSEFNQHIHQNTFLSQNIEFIYTQSAIYGFMMILQNMLTGFLGTFAIVLLLVSMVVIGYNITHALELERKDMGILKTIGFTSFDLRMTQMLLYGFSIISGMIVAVMLSIVLSKSLSLAMVTSTGLVIPTKLPYGLCLILFITMVCLICLFIFYKTRQIKLIAPIQTIQMSQPILSSWQMKISQIKQKQLIFQLSLRQLLSGKKHYIGTLIISMLLVFFLSLVGKINTWIGPHGEGLMDAFSVANHDIGVQPLTNTDMDEIEGLISSYTNIESVYELAMQNVLVEGIDYTANIISDPTYFHMIRGRTSQNADEIVMTEYVANEIGVDIGDSVYIIYGSQNAHYKVVGIYQCANEMGANIGMSVEAFQKIGTMNGYIWCRHYVLSDHSMNDTIMAQLQQHYPLDIAVHTNSWSGLDGIVSTMNLLSIGMYVIVTIFILIVIILTTSKILYSEKSDIAILKSIGLTSYQLRISLSLRLTMVVLIGSLLGTIMCIVFGDPIITYFVTMFGIGEFHSQLDLLNIILPIFATTWLFSIFAYITSYKIRKVALTQLLKGD